MKICLLATFVFFQLLANAQVEFYDRETDRDYEINPQTEKEILNKFLKEQKATAIEFNSNPRTDFPFRLKNKKDNWVLFHEGFENLYMKKEGKKYSFQLPTTLMEERGFTLASRKGKTVFVSFNEKEVQTKMSFDELVPRIETDTMMSYNPSTDVEEEVYHTYLTSFAVKQGEKWGLIELGDSDAHYCVSHNFLYNSPQEVPPARGIQIYQLEMMENIRHEYNVDLLVVLDGYGYLFKGREAKTNLWGVFGGEGEGQAYIPSEYNKLIKHGNVFEVWKNDKVGYYNSDHKLVFEPRFDDFEYVHLDYKYGCALKTNGKWELYDVYSSEKLVEGSATTIDGLIELWLNR